MSNVSVKISKIRDKMKSRNISCFIISSLSDIAWLTNFMGSTAYVVITNKDLFFVTDSRYQTQCEQILTSEWKLNIVSSYDSYFIDVAKKYDIITMQDNATLKLFLLFSKYSKVNIDSSNILLMIRMVKGKDEIESLKYEYYRAAKAFKNAISDFKYNDSEISWAAKLEYHMRCCGAITPSFNTIVASGDRGALPHGVASNKIITFDEAVTIDFGTKFLYASDYTRVVYSGNNSEILSIINIVIDAINISIDTIKPGVKASDIHKAAAKYIEYKGYGKYFIHSLGHGVGVDVHELPLISLKSEDIIEKGMVFTIEPGIYIPNKYGIRLEQTVLVGEQGVDVISNCLEDYVYKIY